MHRDLNYIEQEVAVNYRDHWKASFLRMIAPRQRDIYRVAAEIIGNDYELIVTVG
jgi:hypothetical protein